MRNVFAIAKRELLSFFVSPIAYLVIAGFAVLAGYFFFNWLGVFNYNVARYSAMAAFKGGGIEAPNLNQWVIEGFYHVLIIVLVFLIPLLTMRLIAEERKAGTFELLVTSPVKVWEIVLGKYLAVATVLTIMIGLVFLFPLLLCLYGNPEVPPIFSGAFGLLLCAFAFASIGMAVSSFTENQIVAGVASMVVLLLLYVIHSPAEQLGDGVVSQILNSLSPIMQVQDLIRGVISVKSLVYFISLSTFGILLSVRALEAYRWR